MPAQGEVLLSEFAVAKLCGVHVATVGRWQRRGIGPLCQRRGRRVIYDQAAVLNWWNHRRRP
jgi:phage terminase Nu1 subunit (DNA packaging protein)